MRISIGHFASLTLAMAAATTALLGSERDARACGGCFAPPTESESVVTDHRMILSISSKQTTLYDQIRYSGSPSSFAWVLPVADSNAATLGLSADVVFASLDSLTTTQVQQPPLNCPAPPDNCRSLSTPTAGVANDGASGGGVVVNKHEVVGPYVTDYLHSTDPQALNTWLTAHGYAVPADVAPVISAYVTEHYDFIAMKLVPGAGVSAMRPVRVTTPGASPTLPLRMIAAGSGQTVGITLWVLGDGRYETANFPSFIIRSADITWDWASSGSDYATLRTQNEANLGNRGWEIESSVTLSQNLIQNVVLNGGYNYGGGRPIAQYDAGNDYLPVGNTDPDAGADAGTFESADEVRTADLATLFAGIDPNNTRVTRIRSDLAHASLATDLTLAASADQSELSNIRIPTKEAGQPNCPVYSGCEQVGTAPRDQAASQSHGSSFSCATHPTTARWPFAAGIIAGLFGLQLARRRRSARK